MQWDVCGREHKESGHPRPASTLPECVLGGESSKAAKGQGCLCLVPSSVPLKQAAFTSFPALTSQRLQLPSPWPLFDASLCCFQDDLLESVVGLGMSTPVLPELLLAASE